MIPNKSKINKTILNPKIKPDLLRNNEWQALLRKQFAHIQKLKVTNVGDEAFYSDFEVFNPQTKNRYKVAIRSITEPQNFCSCYDFKTNKLGTCKHIEAVFFQLESLPNFEILAANIPQKRHSTIYVDYLHHRKIKIRIGIEKTIEIKELTKKFFDENGFLIEENITSFSNVLLQFKSDYNLVIYDDAHKLIAAVAEQQWRINTIKQLENTNDLQVFAHHKLYQHQINAAVFILTNAKVIVNTQLGIGIGVTAIAAIKLARTYFAINKILIVTSNKNYWETKIDIFLNEKTINIAGNDFARKKAIEANTTLIKISTANNAALDAKLINQVGFDFIIFDDASVFDNLNNAVCKQLKTIKSNFLLLLSNIDLKVNLEAFYSQIQTIDMYLPGSIFNFINRYAIKNAQGKIVAQKNTEELLLHLQKHYLSIDFADIAENIETKVSKKVLVKLTAQHQQYYENFRGEIAENFAQKSKILQLEQLNNLQKLCTSSFLFNNTNVESKLPVLIEILRWLKLNTYNILIVSSWPEYNNFIQTYLQHNNFEINTTEQSNLHINNLQNIRASDIAKYNIIICMDVESNVGISQQMSLEKCLKYVLIADDTFEIELLNANPKSETEKVELGTKYLSINKSQQLISTPNTKDIQLSFLGDDDVEEVNNTAIEEIIELYNQLKIKLNDTEIKNNLKYNIALPNLLKEFVQLIEKEQNN